VFIKELGGVSQTLTSWVYGSTFCSNPQGPLLKPLPLIIKSCTSVF